MLVEPPVPWTGAAPGGVAVELRVAGGTLDPHLRPVGVELLGDQGGDAGVDALAAVHVRGEHGDRVVGCDAEIGVERVAAAAGAAGLVVAAAS